uniref:Bms1-type G domain-containing protein n=2 Tax=Kalanchoe fedtschenkoi TaxID=63787 RepID=A0A7N0URR4_KALFE
MAGKRAQANKPHKSRFASKSSLNLHRTSSVAAGGCRVGKKSSVAKEAKAARIQRSKAKRDQNRAALLKERRDAACSSSANAVAPRVTVLFGLSADVNLNSLEKDIWSVLSTNGSQASYPTIASSEYKQRMTFLKAPHGDLLSCVEMAKVADLMCFVASATYVSDGSSLYIDSFGDQCLSVFRSLGLPSSVVLIRDLPSESRKRNQARTACISSLASEFPEECKFFPADTNEELRKFMWLLKEQTLKIPHWRTYRPYLMVDKIDLAADGYNAGKCTLLLTGYLRVQSLSINQPVHIAGAGDFQLSKIEIFNDLCPSNERKPHDLMDADSRQGLEIIKSLIPGMLKQELPLCENGPDPLSGEQTRSMEAEMAEAAQKHKKCKRLKRKIVPPGTSEYQAAWYLDESDSANDSGVDDSMVLDEDASPFYKSSADTGLVDGQASFNLRDDDGETEADSMMMEGEYLTREQLQEDIQRIKEAHAEDEKYPDEVETPLDRRATERFKNYKALSRNGDWKAVEPLPDDYPEFPDSDNYRRIRKHVLAKAPDQENGDDVAAANSYIRLHVMDVPVSIATKLCLNAKRMPLIASGLLHHESKMSVLHFSIKKHDSYSDPIKSKEQLIFHVGFRQFLARPIFSSDNIRSDKHKMERFIHPGRFSIASIYAPASFPPLPLVVFKEIGGSESPVVAAAGSLKSIDRERIVLKRIILTGYPQRVSKLKCTVRYMFHNPEDVRHFQKQEVELWTKCGRRGRIKEPVGTHGTMKCILNGVLQQKDTVCMSLFKRVYPKWPEQLFPLQNA